MPGINDSPNRSEELNDEPQQPSTSREELEAQFEEANRERSQFREMALRAQADLTNYRKRMEEERGDIFHAAASRVINKLLPIVDDLQRALEQAPPGGEDAPWVEGVRIIEKNLKAMLESEGVTSIEAEGKPFDPWEHEAIMSLRSNDHEPGIVAQVIRPGYKMRNKILRAAQVAIAQEQQPEEEE